LQLKHATGGRLTLLWSWGMVVAVISAGMSLRVSPDSSDDSVNVTYLIGDAIPVLLVASITPAVIGFLAYAQLAALEGQRQLSSVRATVSQAAAFLNVIASIATLLMFFGLKQ
jgi:hypothetical protein